MPGGRCAGPVDRSDHRGAVRASRLAAQGRTRAGGVTGSLPDVAGAAFYDVPVDLGADRLAEQRLVTREELVAEGERLADVRGAQADQEALGLEMRSSEADLRDAWTDERERRLDQRHSAADARDRRADRRDAVAAARQAAADDRDRLADQREADLDARERAADQREIDGELYIGDAPA